MKKFLVAGVFTMLIMVMNSCDYDDSEDIDILIPSDNPKAKTSIVDKPASKS